MAETVVKPSDSPNDIENFVRVETARSEFRAGVFVGQQKSRLKTHYPSRDWDAREWEDELLAMLADFGEERMEIGITAGIRQGWIREDGTRNTSFAPAIAEMRNTIAEARVKRTSIRQPDPGCKNCGGTGWGLAVQAGLAGQAIAAAPLGPRTVKRCDCARAK